MSTRIRRKHWKGHPVTENRTTPFYGAGGGVITNHVTDQCDCVSVHTPPGMFSTVTVTKNGTGDEPITDLRFSGKAHDDETENETVKEGTMIDRVSEALFMIGLVGLSVCLFLVLLLTGIAAFVAGLWPLTIVIGLTISMLLGATLKVR